MKDILSGKKGVIILAVVVVVLLIIMFAIIIKGKLKDAEQEEIPVQQEIVLNEELENKLERYIRELSYGVYCDIPTAKPYDGDCLYRNDVTRRENISITNRIYSLVLALGTVKDNNKMVGTIIVNGHSFTNPDYISVDEVEKEYHRLYGKNESFFAETINNISRDIKYDKDRKKYFYIDEKTNNFVRTYIEKFEKNNNEVYVYVRVGFVSTEDNYKYLVYRDRDKKNEITTLTRSQIKEYNVVNSSNYTKFNQYKFMFLQEADTNNLIFTRAERVK